MARIPRRVLFSTAVALSLAVAFLAGFTLERSLPHDPDPRSAGSSLVALDFSLIHEAWDVIEKNYVDRPALQEETLTYGAIDGMVNALGDTGHTRFLTPRMVAEEHSFLQGRYVGVGLQIEMKNGRPTIVAPVDNSPAFRAGLRSGQQILKVDGKSVAELSIDEVARRIMGPVGSPVTLSVFDAGTGATTDVPLVRAEIEMANVSSQMIPGTTIADIRIAAFSAGVTRSVRAALEEAQGRGATGVVLDLRNDPGGQLDEAVGVASQFLKTGDVLIEQNAQGERHPDPVKSGGIAPAMPLVVLINNGTASAAEIVAGALQSQKRAPIAGEASFGTGTVLQIFRLSGGSEILLAVEEWLTPLGQTIWHTGIKPDASIALKTDLDLLMPSQLKGMSREQFNASPDLQLMKAVELLAQEPHAAGPAPGRVGAAESRH